MKVFCVIKLSPFFTTNFPPFSFPIVLTNCPFLFTTNFTFFHWKFSLFYYKCSHFFHYQFSPFHFYSIPIVPFSPLPFSPYQFSPQIVLFSLPIVSINCFPFHYWYSLFQYQLSSFFNYCTKFHLFSLQNFLFFFPLPIFLEDRKMMRQYTGKINS